MPMSSPAAPGLRLSHTELTSIAHNSRTTSQIQTWVYLLHKYKKSMIRILIQASWAKKKQIEIRSGS